MFRAENPSAFERSPQLVTGHEDFGFDGVFLFYGSSTKRVFPPLQEKRSGDNQVRL